MNVPLFDFYALRITPLFLLGMVVALILGLNATFMLIAPSRYGIFPRWLRPSNAAIERQLGRRTGTTEIRITGFLVLTLLTWVVYDMVNRPR